MDKNSNKQDIVKRFASKGIFPYQMAFTLLIPLRNIFLSPKQLIKRLELKEDSNVLEVGPGPGYFSIAIAKTLSRGKLVLADIQQEMLDYARKRINKKGITNVDYYLCNGIEFEFPDNSFDRIFMVTVLGEIENKTAYISEFNRIIKSGGILSISELAGDPDKFSVEEVKELVQNLGFEFYKIFGNNKNYTINFKKK
jgi:ubiquinone/menaquinone biosynthesis C-methylase UbiE